MSFIPPGISQGLANLIQNNMLSRVVRDSLTASSRYRADAVRQKLNPGTGQTATFNRLGMFAVDARAAAPMGAPARASYTAEQFIANPRPYAKSFDLDAPTQYVQVGDMNWQVLSRMAEWAGRTSSRVCRAKLFAYCGGQSVIRRAQISSDSVLLVDSLAGFRTTLVNGVPTPVSSTNQLPVTIVAGSTFAALVTGVTPVDPDFPDGVGELTLSAVLGATVAANSYVVLTSGAPYIVRPNSATPGTSRVSTEALIAADQPTLQTVLQMRQKMVDQGVPTHPDGTYHLHVDATFLAYITNDTAFRQAFQTQGLSPIFGSGSQRSDLYNITIIENNDSPAMGKGSIAVVGGGAQSVDGLIINYNGANGAGTPLASKTMVDIGLPVVNSAGVIIRRAVMTGGDVLIESFVDNMDLLALVRAQKIGDVSSNLATWQVGSNQIIAGNVEGWTLFLRPPVDERMLVSTITVANTFDFVAGSDSNAASDTSDPRLLKRAVVMEYGSSW